MRKEWPFENGPKKRQNHSDMFSQKCVFVRRGRTKSEEGLVSSLV